MIPTPGPHARGLPRVLPRRIAALALLIAVTGTSAHPVRAQDRAHPMRDMMRGMMQGQVPPPGMTPEALPAPESSGARLLARYCAQCHDLPSPRYRTATQWPDILARMIGRMRMMSGGGMMGSGMMGMERLEAPSREEERTLMSYLLGNSMVPASPAELLAGDPDGRAAFAAGCSLCHAPPSPALHRPDEWPGVVARMQGNRLLMKKPPLTAPQLDAIVEFLRAASRAPANR